MGLQVEIRPVGDPFELAPAPGEGELDVRRRRRVVRQVLGGVLTEAQLVPADPEPLVPGEPLLAPVGEPAVGVGRGDEVLKLHHLELAGAEHEVARRDLVAEAAAELGDPEGGLAAHRRHHVQEVDEHPLGGLWPQVGNGGLVLDGADEGLEHEVERPGLGEIGGAAVRAGAVDLVGAPALVARPTVDERVDERLEVARRLPDLRVRDDRGLDRHDVVAFAHDRAPPGVPDVPEHQRAERSVVVGRADAAVDLSGGEDEAPPFREVDDRVEQPRVLGWRAVLFGAFLRHIPRLARAAVAESRRAPPAPPPGRDYAGAVSSAT